MTRNNIFILNEVVSCPLLIAVGSHWQERTMSPPPLIREILTIETIKKSRWNPLDLEKWLRALPDALPGKITCYALAPAYVW